MPKLSFPLSASPLGITSGIFTRMPGILVSCARDITLWNQERERERERARREGEVATLRMHVNYERANV